MNNDMPNYRLILRDVFAGLAMLAMKPAASALYDEDTAARAYQVADAMMEARNRRGED